jgi:hypothetical protein
MYASVLHECRTLLRNFILRNYWIQCPTINSQPLDNLLSDYRIRTLEVLSGILNLYVEQAEGGPWEGVSCFALPGAFGMI